MQASSRHASKFLLPPEPLSTKDRGRGSAAARQIVAEATPEVRALAAAAYAAQARAAKPRLMTPAYGAPPRPREASPQPTAHSQRQVKTQRVDDGMEQSLVVYEAPPQSSAPMQPAAPMQHIAEISQSSAATIGSIVTAATAVEGVDQPYQQPLAIAAVPFSFAEGAAAAPDFQSLQQSLADVIESRQQAVLAHKQFLASSKAAEKALRELLPAHAAPAQPMQPPIAQPPKQKPPQQKPAKQPSKQPSKQPIQQPAKPPATPLFSEVLAAGCGAMVTAMLPAAMQIQPQWQQQSHQRKAQRPKQQHQQQQQTQKQIHQQPKRQATALVGVDRFPHLLHFTLSGKGLGTLGSAAEVVRGQVAKVDGGAGVVVVDAVRLGPAASPRFQFKVATLEQADALVRGRGKAFAGSGIVLSEVLSLAERALHTQLYPDFLRLKAAGHRVQFRRARLFVDGQLWSLAMAPAAA